MIRPLGGVACAAVVSGVGAVMLGEQPLEGFTVLIAGVLLGLAVGEVVVSVAGYGDPWLAGSAALVSQEGLVWALHIETGHELREAAPEAWLAVVLCAVAAAGWVRSAGRRGRGSSSGP